MMTSRERLVAAARGGSPDQTPIIGQDALLVSLNDLTSTRSKHPDQAVIAVVPAPLTQALRKSQNIFTLLESDPEAGNRALDELVASTQVAMNDALHAGADGICYLIEGAHPAASTPMQYGGFFLERDRELLAAVAEATFNIVAIAGTEEPYIDFVSDLPAHAFAWQTESGWTPAQVAELRNGALAADHPEAQIQFPNPAFEMMRQTQEANAKS